MDEFLFIIIKINSCQKITTNQTFRQFSKKKAPVDNNLEKSYL
jgi:hypothetical protein